MLMPCTDEVGASAGSVAGHTEAQGCLGTSTRRWHLTSVAVNTQESRFP